MIELNRGIRQVVDEDLRDFSGAPYSLPRRSTAIGDGRSTLAERDKRYDQIHIGFTDTFSPSSAQAFALTENNLYTLEAFDEYFDHLAAGRRAERVAAAAPMGDEALRATVLTLEALRRRGVAQPRAQRRRGAGPRDVSRTLYGTILARLEPFTPARAGAGAPARARARARHRLRARRALLRRSGASSRGPPSPTRSARATAWTSARPPTTSRSSST